MEKSIPIENSGQIGVLVASSISIFIATVSVGLRIIAKRLTGGLDYSEYCIIAALFWNTCLHGCGMLLVTHGGFGFHTQEIYERFGPGVATFFFKGIMAFALLWNATVCFGKLSVLLMYAALIPVKSMIFWCKVLGGIIIAWNVGDIIAGFLICRPLAKNWDFTIEGTCGSQPNFYFAMGMVNIISDIFLIGLPMPYLWDLKMPMKKKLIAAGMLSIGIMTWVIAIYRQTLLPTLDFVNMTYDGVVVTLLSGLEPAVAIALACLPLLRPLLGRRKKHGNTKTGYDYGSNSGSALYSKQGIRSASRGPFAELEDGEVDDNDNSSEVQLQPVKPIREVNISAKGEPLDNSPPRFNMAAISVEKRFEVTSS